MSATTERGTRVVDVAPELVELTNHLFDGDQLFLPFLKLGHYATDNPAAHGYVAFTLDVDGNLPVAKHPLTGNWSTRVEEDGRLLWCDIRLLSHGMACEGCWSRAWKPIAERVGELGAGEGIFALAQLGAGSFVVDAEDLR